MMPHTSLVQIRDSLGWKLFFDLLDDRPQDESSVLPLSRHGQIFIVEGLKLLDREFFSASSLNDTVSFWVLLPVSFAAFMISFVMVFEVCFCLSSGRKLF